MRLTIALLISILCINHLQAQRELNTSRISESIKIDGELNEPAWERAEAATDFINWQPQAGESPTHKTEVKILYDDKAVYIGALMRTNSREDIQTELSVRDNIGNTDWFGLILDTYGNGTEGSEFIVAATGVQFDAKVTMNGEDENWNEVWFSEVKLTNEGWVAELKIPYSAIRFPNTDVQNWRFNLMRRIAGTGEKCSFQYIDPEVNGFINQSAFLKGVKNIKSPIRLSLSPYITTYMQKSNSGGDESISSTGYSYSGGLDLKYGINEAFTLDMTLIPDFGQVQSDDRVLNLSPFEVFYDENRAFFTEGLDLFNKASIFYTRRVGGTPPGYWSAGHNMGEREMLESNPQETQLYNATKVSGRTSSGLGIGVFNAVAGATSALYRNLDTDELREEMTAPLTNYNVVVFDQNLRNNSSVSLINTNVWRGGKEFHNANVTGMEFDLRNNKQTYSLSGEGSVSQLIFKEAENINGVNYEVELSKISGNLRFDLEIGGISKNYNNNDLGFNTQTNTKGYDAGIFYNFNQGWKFLNRGSVWFNSFVNTTYEGNKFSSIHFNSGFWAQTKKQWELNMWTNYRPGTRDFFEPRVDGRFLERPGFYNMGWWVGSDSRKKFRVGTRVFGMKLFGDDGFISEFEVNPRYRFSDKFSLFMGVESTFSNNTRGFVAFSNEEPIIGLRDQVTINNILGATYTFNSKMSVNVRARHYWSKVQYDDFYSLTADGELGNSDYSEFNDFTFNVFNIDLNYTWRFAPGSDLIFNWKNNISGGEFSDQIDFSNKNYFNGVSQLGELPSTNSISVRLVYFLNAANFL